MHLWLNMHTVQYEAMKAYRVINDYADTCRKRSRFLLQWHMVNNFTFEKEKKTYDKGNKKYNLIFFKFCVHVTRGWLRWHMPKKLLTAQTQCQRSHGYGVRVALDCGGVLKYFLWFRPRARVARAAKCSFLKNHIDLFKFTFFWTFSETFIIHQRTIAEKKIQNSNLSGVIWFILHIHLTHFLHTPVLYNLVSATV